MLSLILGLLINRIEEGYLCFEYRLLFEVKILQKVLISSALISEIYMLKSIFSFPAVKCGSSKGMHQKLFGWLQFVWPHIERF